MNRFLTSWKFTFVMLLFVVAGWAGASAAANPPPAGGQPAGVDNSQQTPPTIEIPEVKYDFGEKLEDGEVSHDFVVRNKGRGPLSIDRVQTSWGCTVAHYDRAIPPGGEGKVTLRVSLRGFSGKITKTATVQSNDPRNPEMKLQIEGTVKQIIEVRPSLSAILRGPADQVGETTFDVVGSTTPFHITSTESNLNEQIVFSVETVEEGKHYKVKVGNKLKQGNYAGFLKLSTDLPQKSEILIRVNGMIEGEITIRPQVVLIGKFGAEQPPRNGRVEIRSSRNKPFHITKLTYDAQLMSISQQSLPDSESAYALEIEPRLDTLAPGSRQQAVIAIETDLTGGESQNVQVHILNSSDQPQQQSGSPRSRSRGAREPME